MSVRFFKILSGVLLFYLVALNVVWVSFSAPLPRPPATFTYEGALPSGGNDAPSPDVWQKGKISDQISVDHFEASYFNRWIEIRDPSKSFTYVHSRF